MMATGAQIVQAVEQYTGVPYSQANPQNPAKGLDCSGLVELALSNLGISVPRTTSQQLAAANSGQVGHNIGTNLSQAQPGDVIHYAGHEEVWLGNGQVFSEATYGTKAAIRGRTPEPIIGIVRYSDGSASGDGGAVLASDPLPGGSINPLNWPSEIEDWVSSWIVRVGLIMLGGLLLLIGGYIALRDTATGSDAISGMKRAAGAAAVVV